METYLTFLLGKELFAVPVTKVLEVLQKQLITHVPKTADHILGIINFRGDILPVVHTRKKFKLEVKENEEKYVVIVFEIQNNENNKTIIAATADSVQDVIQISEQDIKPVPELGLDFDSRFIRGAVHNQTGFILILDIEKIFSEKDLAVAQTIISNQNVTEQQ